MSSWATYLKSSNRFFFFLKFRLVDVYPHQVVGRISGKREMCGNDQASHMNLATRNSSSFCKIRCHILYNYMPCHCLPDTKPLVSVSSLGTSLAWFSLTVLPETGCKAVYLFSSRDQIREGRRGNEFIAL